MMINTFRFSENRVKNKHSNTFLYCTDMHE